MANTTPVPPDVLLGLLQSLLENSAILPLVGHDHFTSFLKSSIAFSFIDV
jgi:hypothetical protein